MHSKILSVLSLVALFGSGIANPTYAQLAEAEQKPDVGFKFMTTTLSGYLVDDGFVPYDQPVAQGQIAYKTAFGAYARGWGSWGENGGREFDGTLGLEKGCWDGSVGYFFNAGGMPDDIIQSTLAWGCWRESSHHKTKPYVAVDWVDVVDRSQLSGWFWRVGISDEWSRRADLSIQQELFLLHTSGIFESEDGFVLRYQMAWAKQYGVTKDDEAGYWVAPLARLSLPVFDTAKDRDIEVVVGLRVTR